MELFSRRVFDLPSASTSVKFYPKSTSFNTESEIPPIVGQAPSMLHRKVTYKSVDSKSTDQKTKLAKGLPSISPLRHYSGLQSQKTLLYYQFNYGQQTPEIQSYKINPVQSDPKQFSSTSSHMKIKKEKIRYASALKRDLFSQPPQLSTSKPLDQALFQADKIPNDIEKPAKQEERKEEPVDDEKESKQKKLEEKLKKDPILIRDLKDVFEIHCIDQDRKMKYDFYCDKQVLIKHILYFSKKKYLKDEAISDLDISIFCEVKIFSWLMRYIRYKEYSQNLDYFEPILTERKLKIPSNPQISKEKCLSILVSSHFLNIPDLYEEACVYVKDHLAYLIRHKYQFNLINKEIIKKLATSLTDSELYQIEDQFDRVKSRLYEQKLELLLAQNEANQLYRCVYCNRLFTLQQRETMSCERAKIFIDYRGQVISRHVADRDFDLQQFIVSLRNKKWLWQKIYLNFCSIFVQFHCTVCDSDFNASEITACAWHPKPAGFMTGSNIGKFPCCGQTTMRFSTAGQKSGCIYKAHTIAEQSENEEQKAFIMSIASELAIETSEECQSKSVLQQALLQFTSQSKTGQENEHFLCEDEDECDQPVAERNLKNFKPLSNITEPLSIHPDKQVCSIDPFVWRTDCIRQNDKAKMRELTEKLMKCRDNEVKPAEPIGRMQKQKVTPNKLAGIRRVQGTVKHWK